VMLRVATDLFERQIGSPMIRVNERVGEKQ
jgi:hypothetical protein